jgi:hypothetical protein
MAIRLYVALGLFMLALAGGTAAIHVQVTCSAIISTDAPAPGKHLNDAVGGICRP